MGCCVSSPHGKRRYRDPADLDEVIVPLRHFGNFRNNSNVIPDDIDGLPSTHISQHLATDPDTILYEAEMDQGRAWRCIRPSFVLWILPHTWPFLLSRGLSNLCVTCTCDEVCCWLRKEYSTRGYYHVYPNRIEINNPRARLLWGTCGCGSWNSDNIYTHPFDRGAFGFRRVKTFIINYVCFLWPIYGGVVARQRCPCNGSLWNRLGDCGGWWCDEWCCDIMFCTFRYYGLADADETAFASAIALQAYFEGRVISREDMDKCLEYWRTNISEMGDPVGRKRDVCCEPFALPIPSCAFCYEHCTHHKRTIPYPEDERTEEMEEVYAKYAELREKQIKNYREFRGPVQYSTFCRMCGCRRVFGRRGLFFCTEGCCDSANCSRKAGDPAPTFEHPDWDDDNDAAKVLMTVIGKPPANVAYTRWERNHETGENVPAETLTAKEESLVQRTNTVVTKEESVDDKGEETAVAAPSLVQRTSTAVVKDESVADEAGEKVLVGVEEDKQE